MNSTKIFAKGLLFAAIAVAFGSCCGSNDGSLKQEDFQTTFLGQETNLFTLTNKYGMEVKVTNFGARIVAILVPDKNGNMVDCVIGFKNIKDYTTQPSDFGSSVGRYANRINQGKITIDGTEYQLPQNNFGHCLHGGCQLEPFPQGWQNLVYTVKEMTENSITMELNSPDGEAGFPGNVVATVKYTLYNNDALDIRWTATTDKKTFVNMTNHSYFNLNPDHSMPITNHILTLNASNFTPCDDTYMTTGEILPVAGTPMDFTKPKAIGQDIEKREYAQLEYGNGYDHNWVLDTKGDDTECAAKLYSPVSGIYVEVYTNEPGIQFYSGNFLDGSGRGKQGQKMKQRTGCCLETQKFPDTPNKSDLPGWPSALLSPGEVYYSHCIYQFGVE
ncbi:MAG: galactose mutarotase [Bacteroidaceae bacterium]|nr:galactose mutarotase [Bacteroidaceae bacterium]